jgi:hypothetical protein
LTSGMIASNDDLFRKLQGLVEGWCDRRCLRALRAILHGYPMTSMLTEGWGELLIALQNVRAFAREELTEDERSTVEECISAVDRAVHRR